MKLTPTFSKLEDLKRRMGASSSDWKPSVNQAPLIKKEAGDISEVESKYGLLSVNDEQVMVYIKNARSSEEDLIAHIDNRPRFHVFECPTIKTMRKYERFKHRYVITNEKSGKFDIFPADTERVITEKLFVCKKCLRELNYERYKDHSGKRNEKKRNKIREAFSIADFFIRYSTFFSSKPRHSDKTAPRQRRAANWDAISRACLSRKNYTCEKCHVKSKLGEGLIHCHHKDGDESNDDPSNHEALCVECHSRQPFHGRVQVTPDHKIKLAKLRREQSLPPLPPR